jgi:hypothetical protein
LPDGLGGQAKGNCRNEVSRVNANQRFAVKKGKFFFSDPEWDLTRISCLVAARRDNHRMFIHHVYFWLKPSATQEVQAQLAKDCRELLGKIPGVLHLWAGEPAMTPRDVVDNSYAVGMSVVLKDSAAHDAYQAHPLHLEFIARNKAHWERVRVMDFNG